MARIANPNKQPQLTDEIKKLKAQVKQLQQEKQALEKSWKDKLVEAIEYAYNSGYNDSLDDQTALDEEFDEYMEKAAAEFEKQQLKKISSHSHAKASKKKKTKKS